MLENLKSELTKMIISRCNIYDLDQENYDYDAPLFGGMIEEQEMTENTMDLDSVDALEVVSGIKEMYGVSIDIDESSVFYSISSLAKYIQENTEEQ